LLSIRNSLSTQRRPPDPEDPVKSSTKESQALSLVEVEMITLGAMGLNAPMMLTLWLGAYFQFEQLDLTSSVSMGQAAFIALECKTMKSPIPNSSKGFENIVTEDIVVDH
jgi:hypothetical protein